MRSAAYLLLAVPMLLLAGAAAALTPAEQVGNELAISVCSDNDGDQTETLKDNWLMIFDTNNFISGQYRTHSATYSFRSELGNISCRKDTSDFVCYRALVSRTGNELRRAATWGFCP